jgi:hypothetical protein
VEVVAVAELVDWVVALAQVPTLVALPVMVAQVVSVPQAVPAAL